MERQEDGSPDVATPYANVRTRAVTLLMAALLCAAPATAAGDTARELIRKAMDQGNQSKDP